MRQAILQVTLSATEVENLDPELVFVRVESPAMALGLSRSTVLRLIHTSDSIPTFRRGNALWYEAGALCRHLDRCRPGMTAAVKARVYADALTHQQIIAGELPGEKVKEKVNCDQ